ncbi:MAG: serine/threonine protein kinase, partial [Polyangiaceae bacterium]|nr:serine/threonine protein kinase [Polyangiaceae bacterium]
MYGTEDEDRVGRYQLIRELGSGGMASVYLARIETAEGFSKLVALKRIHEHLGAQPGYVEMFCEEARLTARISHPNVCAVFDFGEENGEPFMAMEYLAGETFASIVEAVAARPWAPEWPFRGAHLIAHAAEGLHAAHELRGDDGSNAGVVHLDVSPNNLVVTYTGAVKVLDFGIARVETSDAIREPAVLRGKIPYLAPEQIVGRNTVDRRVDVWSLGVTLWETLTLRPLFQRTDTLSTLAAVGTGFIPPPSSIRPRIPRAL